MSEKNTSDDASTTPGYTPGKAGGIGEQTQKPIVETVLDLSGGASSGSAASGAEARGEVIEAETTVIETESGTITETTLDLSGGTKKRDAAAATERIRKARGSSAPTARVRERAVDADALKSTSSSTDAAVDGPDGLHPVRTGKQTVSLAVTLWLIAAIIGGLAAFFAWHPGVPGRGDNLAFVDQSQSNEVMAQYSAKACAPFTYDFDKITDDMKRARTTLTGSAREEYDKTAETNRKLVVQTKAVGTCHVDYVALSALEGDRATVLAILIIKVTSGEELLDHVAPRMQATMEKVDGQWLISEVVDVR